MGRFNVRLQSDANYHAEPWNSEFSNDLAVLQSKVAELASHLEDFTSSQAVSHPTDMRLIKEARRIYELRREVDKIFEFEGFSRSPAWDIMLDLFDARCSNKNISVSSAGIGASCPGTTALRWLQALEQQGLIARTSDPTDKRRTMISLTVDGYTRTAHALRLHLKK